MKVIAFIALCLINLVFGSPAWWDGSDDTNFEDFHVRGNVNANRNRNSPYGRFTNIDPSTQIGTGTTVGDFTNIGKHCSFDSMNKIHDNIVIGNFVLLGVNNEIGENSEIANLNSIDLRTDMNTGSTNIGDHTNIQSNCIFGNNVFIGKHCKIFDNVHIGNHELSGTSNEIGGVNMEINTEVENLDAIELRLDQSIDTNSGMSTNIGDHTDIQSGCIIGDNVFIGNHCEFDPANKIYDHVNIGNHVHLGRSNEIGIDSKLSDHVSLGNNIRTGRNTTIFNHATLYDGVDISGGSIVDEHSMIGANTISGANAYFGRHSRIEPNAIIGENSVIHHHALVPGGTSVIKDEVIIRTPTSAALYSNCMPLDQIPQNDVQVMASNSQKSISPEANQLLRQKLINQIHELSENCQNGMSSNLSGVAMIKSLYLILYHGRDNFQTYSQFSGSDTLFLSQEQHFGSRGATRDVLTSEVKDLMVEMLALKQDLQRSRRVSGDTFCKMSHSIENKQRKVRVDQ